MWSHYLPDTTEVMDIQNLVLLELAMKMQLKFKCELSSVGEMNRVVIYL